jgi:xylulokinase
MGVEVNSVRMSGGGANSPFWRQILSDILGVTVSTLTNKEGSAYGAALLALTGGGQYATVEECCAAAIKEADRYTPQPHESAAYTRGYELYSQLYPTLKPIYGVIQQLG